MAMYDVCGPEYCPECPPSFNRKGKRIGEPLRCICDNYSGTGGDVVACEECGKTWFVSYKIDQLNRATKDWDIGTRKQREDTEQKEKLAQKQKELEKAIAFLKTNNHAVERMSP